jgi:hypothetical protein
MPPTERFAHFDRAQVTQVANVMAENVNIALSQTDPAKRRPYDAPKNR